MTDTLQSGVQVRETEPGPRPGRQSDRRLMGVLAALAILVVAGAAFWIGRATAPDAAATPAPAAVTTTVPAAAVTPGPIVADGGEPVAAVAAALTPSVVQLETDVGLGSGVAYTDSLILTAAHVVDGFDTVGVVLADGSRLEGTVLGTDDGTDVAVVQVSAGELIPATLATGVELQVGQAAIAIGSPFGLEGSVTAGVVSSARRAVTSADGRARIMIQTDAPINPGNSGGALADRTGRVIGINDFIVSQSGGNVGVGFAIPIDVAVRTATAIENGETVGVGYLGVTGTAPTTGQAGALITGVLPGTPAEAAGLRVGDLITALDGRAVQSLEDLAAEVQALSPGTTITLDLVRDGQPITVTVEIGTRQ